MTGTIRCARRRCGRVRKEFVCPRCGGTTVYISVQGHYIPRDRQGRVLTDYRQAQDILGEINLRINEGTFDPAEYLPKKIRERAFSAQSRAWLARKEEEATANVLSFETLKDYRGYVKNYFDPRFGDTDVRDIGFEALEAFKDSLPRSLKIKTRRNILNALHALFRRLRRAGTIRAMPAWPALEGDDSEVRAALTREEQAEGLMKIPGREDRAAVEFGFEAFLRPGELCALQVRDFDVINRQVLVRRTWSGKRLQETTKGKNRLWIPLSHRAWQIAAPRLRQRGPEEFVFVNPRTAGPYRPKVLNRLWRAYSGFEVDHYGAGRHSSCTQLVHDGVNVLEVQAAMRHADLRSTQRYFHADREKMRAHFNNRGRRGAGFRKPKKSQTRNDGQGE